MSVYGMRPVKALAYRIQRAGADVAVDDTQGDEELRSRRSWRRVDAAVPAY